MPNEMRAGVAAVNITPPVGVELTGFGSRAGPSAGVHDDLYARALVFDDGALRLGLVTTDLLGLDQQLVDRVRSLASQTAGIPAEALMLNSSHTHSGPASIYLRGLGDVDEPYCDCLVRKIVGALRMAVDNMEPARLSSGRAPVQIGFNRREAHPQRGTVLGHNPTGPVCEEVQVLRVDRADGSPRALFFSHAAHPVVLRGDNLLLSADFVGYAVEGVQGLLGNNVTALFAQSCCGDINARDKGTFEAAASLGRMLAGAAVAAAELAEPHGSTVLGAHSSLLALPYLRPPSVEEAERQCQAARQDVQRSQGPDVGWGKRKTAAATAAWAEDMLRVARSETIDEAAEFELQALRIGDVAIVGLEGEVFVSYAHNIRARSPFTDTLVLAYTNGCIGYVPTADAYPHGGYEVTSAYKYYGTQMIAPQSEGIILDEAERLLADLHRI